MTIKSENKDIIVAYIERNGYISIDEPEGGPICMNKYIGSTILAISFKSEKTMNVTTNVGSFQININTETENDEFSLKYYL